MNKASKVVASAVFSVCASNALGADNKRVSQIEDNASEYIVKGAKLIDQGYFSLGLAHCDSARLMLINEKFKGLSDAQKNYHRSLIKVAANCIIMAQDRAEATHAESVPSPEAK